MNYLFLLLYTIIKVIQNVCIHTRTDVAFGTGFSVDLSSSVFVTNTRKACHVFAEIAPEML